MKSHYDKGIDASAEETRVTYDEKREDETIVTINQELVVKTRKSCHQAENIDSVERFLHAMSKEKNVGRQ